jgi:hypothetical protein
VVAFCGSMAPMDPDVARAVDRLAAAGVLTTDQAGILGRVARGELVSVRTELRTLLYGGVLATTAGVGLLVAQNLDRIGPVALAVALGLSWLLCLLWVMRHAKPFSWAEAAPTHLAFDYVLLLGVLLFGAWLAYLELHFTPLGDAWTWHLLIVCFVTGALALRYDSRTLFSLSLTSFAAWRGVSLAALERGFLPWASVALELRTNALGCGILFVLLGLGLVRGARKAHFEPVAVHLGWLLVLLALVSGLSEANRPVWAMVLLLVGGGLGALAFWQGRFVLFVFGVFGAYIGLSVLFFELHPDDYGAVLWFLVTAGAVLLGLLLAHQRLSRVA